MRIVAFAYACDPEEGSEPALGWTWIRMLSQLGQVTAITRENNRESIERHLAALPAAERPTFAYVDLPPLLRRWKRGQRGIRLYYLLWQLAALRATQALHRKRPFDVAWHVTMANAWLGSGASLLGVPFVYGPVGGGVAMPWRFARTLGLRGVMYELVREGTRHLGLALNPLARLACRRATLILAANHETSVWLAGRGRVEPVVFPHIVIDAVQLPELDAPSSEPQWTALFPARLLPWKGGGLALEVIAAAPGWRLVVCGKGPDLGRLRRRALELGIDNRVEFAGVEPRPRVIERMRRSHALLLPSLHEEGSFVVSEARSMGLPVVCFDRGGPAVLAGPHAERVSVTNPRAAVAALAEALRLVAVRGRNLPDDYLALEATRERLAALLRSRGILPDRDPPTPGRGVVFL